MKTTLIAGGILIQDDQILLVEQQGPEDEHSSWAIPAGRVEVGETLDTALVREFHEETGLTLEQIGNIIYGNHLIDQANQRQLIMYCYTIRAWSGDLRIDDPDDVILDVKFVDIAEAANLIEQTQDFQPMREPIVAYLRDKVPAGTMWIYERQSDAVNLKARLY